MLVICIGELTVDWLAEKPGQSLLEPGSFYRCLGGNASNVAIGLARLGTPVRLIAKVGADVDGAYLRKTLQDERVDIEYILVDPEHHTAQCYCLTLADGEHAYYNFPRQNAAAMLNPGELSRLPFGQARFLHATGISFTAEPRRSAVAQAMELAREMDLIVSFDGSFPTGQDDEARRSFEKAFARADILKVNLAELLFWSGENCSRAAAAGNAPAAAAQLLLDKYKLKLVAATLGANGSVLATRGGTVVCPALPVTCVDGIGAGDGFTAGLLHALSKKLGDSATPEKLDAIAPPDWLEIGRIANAVGALATTKLGAWQGLPRAGDLLSLLNAS